MVSFTNMLHLETETAATVAVARRLTLMVDYKHQVEGLKCLLEA